MRPIWSGSISFGLVNIPVKMYSGSQVHEGLDLDMLHKNDEAPIRYARICRRDGKEIPYDDIVKGYEYRDGDYVVLTKDDFKKADARKTRTIDIKQFVDQDEIDIRYFDKPYYLESDRGAAKAYTLLREALERSRKVGLVKYVMRSRENMGVIKPLGKALILNQLRYPADVRSPSKLNLPGKEDISDSEVKMALALISQLTKPFIAEDWHDTYTEELEEIIQEKAKGQKPKAHGKPPEVTKVNDLMATLKASLKE